MEHTVGARSKLSAVQLVCESWVEGFGDERGLSRATHPGNGNECAEGEACSDVAQVVERRTLQD